MPFHVREEPVSRTFATLCSNINGDEGRGELANVLRNFKYKQDDEAWFRLLDSGRFLVENWEGTRKNLLRPIARVLEGCMRLCSKQTNQTT